MQWQGETSGCEDVSASSLYFPGVRSGDGWNTEISIINPSAEESLSGMLRGYTESGREISQQVFISLPPHGRQEAMIGDLFTEPLDIASLVFESCIPRRGLRKVF